jgi:hypothetical protein
VWLSADMKKNFELLFKTPQDCHYFFGYYDKPAMDKNGKRLLAQKTKFIDRMPTGEDELSIGIFDLESEAGEFIPLAKAKAWNWQQGCMLQWLGPDHESKIIYNDRRNGRFVSVVLDIDQQSETEYEMAVYTVNKHGTKALCVDNERLCWFRQGYSYEGIRNQKKNKKIDLDDGIWLLDIETGSTRRIINLGDLVESKALDNMRNATHYVEHLMFSPNGERFQFVHRWILPDGGIYTRLYVANTDGSNVTLINDSGRITHCCWRDDNTVLGWGAVKNSLNILRRFKLVSKYIIKPLMPVYRSLAKGNSITGNTAISRLATGDSYLSIDVNTGITERVLPGLLNKDGHPTVLSSNRDLFITDTYATSEGELDLMVCDIRKNNVVNVDRLKSIGRFDATTLRCDLHPKLSYDGKSVAIDTMNDGCRSIYVYRIDQ